MASATIRRRVRAFDCFDTLLARRVARPTDVFDLVERRCRVRGLAAARLAAEAHVRAAANVSAPVTLERIYERLGDALHLTHAATEAARRAELDVEADVCFLIAHTAALVRDGDLVVSDMYLSAAQILALLRHAGFTPVVDVVVSDGGKARGTIWPPLARAYDIEWMLGDSPTSDVVSPRSHGIEGRLSSVHDLTECERALVDAGAPRAAAALREFRLTTPPPAAFPLTPAEDAQVRLHAGDGAALLIHFAAAVADAAARAGCGAVLLTTRDCCLLAHVLPSLAPHLRIARLASSRAVNAAADGDYLDYLRALVAAHGGVANCLVVDVQGSFASGRRVWARACGALPHVFVLCLARFPPSEADKAPLPCMAWTHDQLPRGAVLEELAPPTEGPLIAVRRRCDGGGGFDEVRTPLHGVPFALAAAVHAVARSLAAFLDAPAPWWWDVARVGDELRGDAIPSPTHGLWRDVVLRAIDAHCAVTRPDGRMDLRVAGDHVRLGAHPAWSRGGRTAHMAELYERALPLVGGAGAGVALLEIGARCGSGDCSNAADPHAPWTAYFGAALRLCVLLTSDAAILRGDTRSAPPAYAERHILSLPRGDAGALATAVDAVAAVSRVFDAIVDRADITARGTTLRAAWRLLAPGGVYILECAVDGVPIEAARACAWTEAYLCAAFRLSRVDAAAMMPDIERVNVAELGDGTAMIIVRRRGVA